jgi:predicted nucleic acid-binding protein
MKPLTNEQVQALAERGGSAAAARYNQLARKVATGVSTALERSQATKLKEGIDKLLGRVDDEVMRLSQLKREHKSITFRSPIVDGDIVAVVPDAKERNKWLDKESDIEADVVITVDEMLWVMRQPADKRKEIMRGVHIAMKELDGEMVLT